jgi:hypothetical protein
LAGAAGAGLKLGRAKKGRKKAAAFWKKWRKNFWNPGLWGDRQSLIENFFIEFQCVEKKYGAEGVSVVRSGLTSFVERNRSSLHRRTVWT